MNVEAEEVVDVAVVQEEVEAEAEAEAQAEAEAEYEVTIPIIYLVHLLMELLFLNLRNMIMVNINHCPEINKLQSKNSKLQLVGSMDIPRPMDMFLMINDMQLYQQV